MLRIRKITIDDVPTLRELIQELAEFERKPDEVAITDENLARDGFGPEPKFRGLIAEWDGQPVAYAIFFGFYSTWKGAGLFLEDLFVREAYRGRGIGKALLAEVARTAQNESCPTMRWEVLDWNAPAIEFYKSLGAEVSPEWRLVTLDANAIKRFK